MVAAQEVDGLAVLPGDGTQGSPAPEFIPATFGQPPAEFLGVVLAAWHDGARGQDSQFVLQQVEERDGVVKAVHEQHVDHLDSIDMFTSNNSAYKKHHSTETLLVKINSDIMNNMDQQTVTMLVLLDLSAAFDTVSLGILTEIFQFQFGIAGNVLKWFVSYLSDREQRVKIYQTLSDAYKVRVGVPQGSCAGPVAFLGYLSSLYDVIQEHLPEVGGYADDNQLCLAFKPKSDDEQAAINNMNVYC